MKIVNKTDYTFNLDDILNNNTWEVETKPHQHKTVNISLNDWTVVIRYLKGKKPYYSFCNPSKKTITIAINPRNSYPFRDKFAVGTTKLDKTKFKYVYIKAVFGNPYILVRILLLREISHALDYLMGYKIRYKQTRANRFAFMNIVPSCKIASMIF